MSKVQTELALAPYRVLDLTDDKGFLCGKVLGDLGADVIKIEKPGGEPARRLGPFYKDIPDPEKSLYWFAYNSNKRGITLDIETRDGKELFKRLVKKADFVIESFSPGYMEEIGLGYSTLSKINPGIILTSISHFGQAGPYKDYKGCDIVDMAMSGYMFVTGDPDRPPVRITFPQAYLNAGIEAAAGAMIAFYYRQLTGEGQWVDVSIQHSAVRLPFEVRQFWEFTHQIWPRQGPRRGGIFMHVLRRQTWPCKGGAISYELLSGASRANENRALVQWLDSEGMADTFLKDVKWEEFDFATVSEEFIAQVEERLGRFFLTHTVDELCAGAQERRIMIYPILDAKGVVENSQLAAREFWEEVEHPELGASIIYPGAFIKATETPCNIRRRSPLIGEHNDEVYGELGISSEEILILKQSNII